MIIALGFAVSTTVLYFLGVDLLVWVNDISIRKWTTFNELLILLESHVGYYFLLLFVLLGVMSVTMPMSMIMSVGPIAVVQALLVGIIGFALMMFIGIYVFRIERRLVATLTTTVTLKNTKIGKVKSSMTMDSSIASSANLTQVGKNVNVTIKTPKALDTDGIKVFSLKKDTVNNKPYRIVMDVQKQGVAPKSNYYGSKKTTAKSSSSSTKKTSSTSTGAATTISSNGNYKTSGGLAGKVITLDPGHGGSDPGAIGPNGLQEKQVTLPIAKYLKADLEARGAKVYMTRTTDVDVYAPNASGVDELQARVNVANKYNSDAFVSIHINAFSNPSVGGIATYYYSKTGYDAKLAQRVQDQIMNEPKFNGDRGIQEGNLYVLRHSDMPAILVELGFISNPTEEAALNTTKTQQSFAAEIAAGLASYFGG